MDKIGGAFESFTGSGGNTNQGQSQSQSQSTKAGENWQQSSDGNGFLGAVGDKRNGAAGGGKESKENEDMLDMVSPRDSEALGSADVVPGRRLCPREDGTRSAVR